MKKTANSRNIKEKNKEKKDIDKVLVIAIIMCVVLVVGIVLLIVLPEPITAAKNLNDAKKFLASDERIVSVGIVVTSEYGEDFVNSPSVILYDEDAENFSNDVEKLLKNVKYSNTTSVKLGVWKTKIELNNDTERYTIYVDESGVYIQDDNKLIKYTVTEKGKSTHKALLDKIKAEAK